MMKANSKCYYFLFVFLLLQLGSCKDEDKLPEVPVIDLAEERRQMADNLVGNSIVPAYFRLHSGLVELQNQSNSLSNTIDQTQLDALRSNLKNVWLLWQDVAIYQFGPMVNNVLRSQINAYPVDTDLIENNISNEVYNFGSLASQGAEGLPAIDYLINKENALTDLNDAKRQAFLKAAIDHLELKLLDNNDSFGSYFDGFSSEAANGTDVGSALGVLVNGIDLHFQRFLRDGKVAIPAGIRSAGVPRPMATEAFYGGYSLELLDRGLDAYLDMFRGNGVNGNSGKSILTYLKAIEQEALANDIEAKLIECIEKANTLNDPLSTQIEEDVDKVIEVFLVLQELVTLFKSDMASVMGITITNLDTDGD